MGSRMCAELRVEWGGIERCVGGCICVCSLLIFEHLCVFVRVLGGINAQCSRCVIVSF